MTTVPIFLLLFQKFKRKNLGVISRFLGIDFKAESGNITKGQENCLSNVLEWFCMAFCDMVGKIDSKIGNENRASFGENP